MPLLSTYTSLGDVRRLLRSVPPSGRIRFSESFNVLKKSVDNTGSVELTNIYISNEYSDVAHYKLVFSDTTTFTMYRIDAEKLQDINLGSGFKQVTFISSNSDFTVNSGFWVGTALAGDTIEFHTDSHVSLNDGTRFIQDTEFFVDSILEKNIRFSSTSESSLRFDSTSGIPKSVQIASQRLSAYFIYKSVYLEHNTEKTSDNIAIGWFKEGLEMLAAYVEKHNLALSTSAPILGYAGTNQPVDLEDNAIFKSSQFNLYLPIRIGQVGHQGYFLYNKAYNFISASNYLDTVVSDIDLFNLNG